MPLAISRKIRAFLLLQWSLMIIFYIAAEIFIQCVDHDAFLSCASVAGHQVHDPFLLTFSPWCLLSDCPFSPCSKHFPTPPTQMFHFQIYLSFYSLNSNSCLFGVADFHKGMVGSFQLSHAHGAMPSRPLVSSELFPLSE